jgi:hypothetical protein
MSIGVGTLKPSSRSIWPAAVVLSVVMLTVAVIAISLDRGDAVPSTTQKVEAPAVAIVSGTAANTPSELRGATTAERSGAGITFVRHVPKREVGAGTEQPQTSGATPTELSGGMDAKNDFARFGAHQRI